MRAQLQSANARESEPLRWQSPMSKELGQSQGG